VVFTDPPARIKLADIGLHLPPMTAAEILAVEAAARTPPQRLVVALAAVHAAHLGAIWALTSMPSTCPTDASHSPGTRSGSVTSPTRPWRTWLDHRHARWPRTPNRHVLISPPFSLAEPTADVPLSSVSPGAR